jgi:hypothetical protein
MCLTCLLLLLLLLLCMLPSTMALKQATAFHATGDARHAVNAFAIIKAWAETNKSWDLIGQNGPLEAGW